MINTAPLSRYSIVGDGSILFAWNALVGVATTSKGANVGNGSILFVWEK
jgi:hypothetical protein